MRLTHRQVLFLLSGLAFVAVAATHDSRAPTPPYTVHIDATAPHVRVSSNLFGIFFEEINHAGEGGLYAEMIQNRDFEATELPAGAQWAGNLLLTKQRWYERKWFGNDLPGWTMLADEQTQGSIRLDQTEPLNSNNPHSMRLSIRSMGTNAGVANEGFWGMNLRGGSNYDLSFYARTESNTIFTVTVALESADGRVTHANGVIEDVGGSWKRYSLSLCPDTSNPRGRLTLRFDRPGKLWLDVVSLFPRDTFNHRPNGLRPDLVHMLKDLKPAFIRFPGGAIVGGLNLDNRIQWKHSIGDIAQRKGTMNLWGYYTSNGLGFHEYLQLCEDLNADALWVCNPGFSDNYRRAEVCSPEQLDLFVQEALDALEYALGPADSNWGGKRAANGHPDPFSLRYIEIGNEASGDIYERNYRRFFAAIKSKYPQLVIISNEDFKGRAPVEMIDQHKYGTPDSFFAAADSYDGYDRNRPRVYVGEYGCNSGVGQGNLMAALSEAAYLIGLERNGDVVTMSSYAPLFFHVNDIAWPVNMIGFDSSRVFGRSSYYVHKLFVEHRLGEVLRTVLSPASKPGERALYTQAGFDRGARDLIIKVVNRSGTKQPVKFQIDGIAGLGSTAKVTILGHHDPGAENSLFDPEVVVPSVSKLDIAGPGFSYSVPPYSLVVFTIPKQ